MTEFAERLEPSARWIGGLRDGSLEMNPAANRVIDASTKRFVGALVPSDDLSRQLAELPLGPGAARIAIQHSAQLAHISAAVESLQVVSSVAALASVANLCVSCVGFAVIMRRLARIDAKLDTLMGEIQALRDGLSALQIHLEAVSMARIRAAAECLERSLVADHAATRSQLAARARDLFQEARLQYLELWHATRPWHQLDIPVQAALELQGRYVACALGELRAELILGDLGSFRHAAHTAADGVRNDMCLDAVQAYRDRSDQACGAATNRPKSRVAPGLCGVVQFHESSSDLVVALKEAQATTAFNARRLAERADDTDLVGLLGIEPHQFARLGQTAKGTDLYLLRAA